MAEDPKPRPAVVAALAEQLQRLTMAEAGTLSRALETRWRVNAEPVRGAFLVIGDPPPPGYEVNRSSLNLVVTDAGSDRLGLIKEVRSIMGVGVIEAKTLVAALPLTVARGLGAEAARRMKSRLEDCGATVKQEPVAR